MTKRESQSEIPKSNKVVVETSTTDDRISVVPANEASWDDLDVVLGSVPRGTVLLSAAQNPYF